MLSSIVFGVSGKTCSKTLVPGRVVYVFLHFRYFVVKRLEKIISGVTIFLHFRNFVQKGLEKIIPGVITFLHFRYFVQKGLEKNHLRGDNLPPFPLFRAKRARKNPPRGCAFQHSYCVCVPPPLLFFGGGGGNRLGNFAQGKRVIFHQFGYVCPSLIRKKPARESVPGGVLSYKHCSVAATFLYTVR